MAPLNINIKENVTFKMIHDCGIYMINTNGK